MKSDSRAVLFFIVAAITTCFCLIWRIADWPVYFFCDEAVFAQTAYDWIQNWSSTAAPGMYYEVAPGRNIPMLFSYFLAIPAFIFGLSPEITRTSSAIIGMIAVLATSIIIKKFFSQKIWWLTPLLFVICPAWFLHARTAFDMSPAISFFSLTLLFYLLYRTSSPEYIYALVLSAGCYFYIYASSQIILPLITFALLIADFQYHRRNYRIIARALPVALIMIIPVIWMSYGPSAALSGQLSALNSYILQPGTVQEKIAIFIERYAGSFSPAFWFSADDSMHFRHRMLGQGYLPLLIAPLLILGLMRCLTRISEPAFKTIIICVLIIPIPGALVEQSITRISVMLVPVIILSMLGLDLIISRLAFPALFSALLLPALGMRAIFMTHDAVNNGALWYKNYSLYGLQYGTRHIFENEIPMILEKFPDSRIFVTSTFANDPPQLLRFFIRSYKTRNVFIDSINLNQIRDLRNNDIFVIQENEYRQIADSNKFRKIKLIHTLKYPDGTPGFYFVNLEYSENISQILEEEKKQRQIPVESEISINGKTARVFFSRLDIGRIEDAFDGDISTLMRGAEANPFTLRITFSQPRSVKALSAYLGALRVRISGQIVFSDKSTETLEMSIDTRGKTDPFEIFKPADSEYKLVSEISLSILNIDGAEVDHIHIFEVLIEEVETQSTDIINK